MGYILNGTTPIAVNYDTCREWAITVPLADRRVASDEVGDYDVSTVFLKYADDPERLFETMVFKAGTFSNVWGEHAATCEEALQAHKRGCDEARRLTLKGGDGHE